MTPAKRVILFGLALGTSVTVAALVLRGQASKALAMAWFASLFLYAVATRFRRPAGGRRLQRIGVVVLMAALPVLVRLGNMDGDRMHGDEFLTGYFSATHDFAGTNFFGYMPETWEWQGQFPKPYFFLQSVFLALFGESTTSLRLSVQIYVAVVGAMLFLIVREIIDSKSALVAVLLYSFLAPSVYFETLGLFFVSSTAIFMVFFYFGIRYYRTGAMFDAAVTGIACGFCYLTYYSSYLAFPVLLALFTVQWLRRPSARVLQNFSITVGGILAALAPFVAFGLKAGNYVASRPNQISLLTGTWSPHREPIAKGASPVPVLRDNLIHTLKSFVQDGLGGSMGFDFGHLGLFDRFSLGLLVAGIVIGVVMAVRKTELLFVFLVVGAAFVAALVLTIPPPAYHRFSIAFPFLAILMALPISLLLRLQRVPLIVRHALAAGLLLVFVGVNQRRLTEAVFRDQPVDDLRLAALINQRYRARNLYVAGDPAHAFQKVYYFRDRWKSRHVETAYHDALLEKLDPMEKYVYVITLAVHFRERFERADPNGRFVRFSDNYSLFAN